MDTAVEIVSARTRQLFWELSSIIELSPPASMLDR
jgi:hypothetical protein